MQRALIALALALCVLLPQAARAETEVRMTGDARIHANFFLMQNFTGWNYNGRQTMDALTIWERFRLRTDFAASENLAFRLGVRVNNTPWGSGTFTVDNPQVSLEVYQAYLRFIWPGTRVKITAGLQNTDLPVSSGYFNANPVLGGTRSAALTVAAPLMGDALSLVAGYSRLIDTNRDMDPTTTQVADEFDLFFLTLPVALDGVSFTPWTAFGLAGNAVNWQTQTGGPGLDDTLGAGVLSSGYRAAPQGWRNDRNPFLWVGAALSVDALDPWRFNADIIAGQGAWNDRAKSLRGGLFADAAVEYRGFDFAVPKASAWWSTGEDGSTRNGSERLPVLVDSWGPGNTFLFNSGQELSNATLGINPIGTWGVSFTLDQMSFLPKLTHRATFAYVRGLNSLRAVMDGFALWGVCSYFQMGRDLIEGQSVMAVTLDHSYVIQDNLRLVAETGWAHGEFSKPGFCRRHVHQALSGDPWKVSVGVVYRF
ncbi:hypothetical protein NNJEOMEG_02587 [Fundidesulfovibrio magnetotacticus]|uniref:Outer membrane homotrimeric porin n=1 Tax=Fundidesulfovibrio magnetotacticus TaxID=2730080 RepID=A0A6V8LUV7_9BACT|nr:outer membrane homotrimeric porin [Fundidesulfovibrio magnetotacticus]GFK94740.1 hypothetical protein NNJEOMEG_02587 [Fundidesulfovibrio magnetotacticus]